MFLHTDGHNPMYRLYQTRHVLPTQPSVLCTSEMLGPQSLHTFTDLSQTMTITMKLSVNLFTTTYLGFHCCFTVLIILHVNFLCNPLLLTLLWHKMASRALTTL